MSIIKILDDNTINKIAAGEVIEKPASIVKELVENSIDAGADDITIEVSGGGIASIRIIDNGKGIAADDLESAFLRHATSKIENEMDLETIASLGFRGEALASIAAVSKIELMSRIKNAQIGNKIVIHGGKLVSKEECGCPEGTVITIQDVFYNTPARLKFLKSEAREGMYITDVIEGIALSNSKVSIKYKLNNKNILSTRGDSDLKAVLMAVYGKETINNIIPIDFMKDFISVKGFVGNSNLAKSSRNNQSIFINGRIIKNKTITAAVEAAFKSMLTINKFPFFIANLTINPEFVDVNVHPSKAEVKFQDDQLVFKAVYAAVKDAILAISDLGINENIPNIKPSFVANVPLVEYQQEKINFTENVISPLEIAANNRQLQQNQQNNELVQNDRISENTVKDNTICNTRSNTNENETLANKLENQNQNISQNSNSISNSNSSNKSSSDNSTYTETKIEKDYANVHGNDTKNASFTNNEAYSNREKYTPQGLNKNFGSVQGNINDAAPVVAPNYNTPAKIEPLAVIGQLHFMYIVAEGMEEMYLIDQHAAHERIYYEKYLSAYNKASIQSQNLLTPMIIELSLSEKHCVLENAEVFTKLGYEIDDFGGNAISIRAIPVIYGNPNPKVLFNEIIQSMDLKTKDVYSAIDSILYKMSCKSAIKAGDKLGYKEMNELIEQLRRCDNPFNCPHGRPTIIKMSYYELEKKFKRIQ